MADQCDPSVDAFVVWIPGEFERYPPLYGVSDIAAAVRRSYTLLARFGEIEVWRKKPAIGRIGPGTPSRFR